MQQYNTENQSATAIGGSTYFSDKVNYTWLLGDIMQKMSLALLYGQIDAYEMLVAQLFVRLKPYFDEPFKNQMRSIGIDAESFLMQPGTTTTSRALAMRLNCMLSDLMARKGFTPQKHGALDIR